MVNKPEEKPLKNTQKLKKRKNSSAFAITGFTALQKSKAKQTIGLAHVSSRR
jgi:hypothetical protein